MKFSDIIEQAKALLQRQGRITYRSLKREFDLEDEALEDLKFELIDGQELAVDKDGKMLVWVGALRQFRVLSSKFQYQLQPRTPNPSPQSATRRLISPSASAPSKRRWKRAVEQTVSARRSRRCLPISKARRR